MDVELIERLCRVYCEAQGNSWDWLCDAAPTAADTVRLGMRAIFGVFRDIYDDQQAEINHLKTVTSVRNDMMAPGGLQRNYEMILEMLNRSLR